MRNHFVDPDEELDIDTDEDEDVNQLDFPLDDDMDDDDDEWRFLIEPVSTFNSPASGGYKAPKSF